MKHPLALFAVNVVVLVLLVGQSAVATPQSSPAPIYFYGPESFLRGEGTPEVFTRRFAADSLQGPFFLHVRNGNEDGSSRVSSATLSLNGTVLLGTSDFSQGRPAFDIPVILITDNILELNLASAPGSRLTIWIDGQTQTNWVSVTIDSGKTGSASIDRLAGGEVSSTSQDGTTFTLHIPERAFWGMNRVQVTLTPIIGISPVPYKTRFVAGVQFAPDGLTFTRPTTLTMKLPPGEKLNRLHGFMYQGAGTTSSLVPITIDDVNRTVTFSVMHFSGVSLLDGQVIDCESQFTSTDPEVPYEQAVACADTFDDIAIRLRQWFDGFVAPLLNAANSEMTLRFATAAFLTWAAEAERAGCYTDDDWSFFKQQFERAWGLVLEQLEASCLARSQCERYADFDNWLRWQEERIRLGFEAEAFPSPFCNNLGSTIVKDFGVMPPLKRSIVGQEIEFSPAIADAYGETMTPDQVDKVPLSWESRDPSIAQVPDPKRGIVNTLGLGTTTIVATEQCTGLQREASLEVVELASAELEPSVGDIRLDQTQVVRLALKDAAGRPIDVEAGMVHWSMTPLGIGFLQLRSPSEVEFTPSLGGIVTLTATAGGKLAQSTIYAGIPHAGDVQTFHYSQSYTRVPLKSPPTSSSWSATYSLSVEIARYTATVAPILRGYGEIGAGSQPILQEVLHRFPDVNIWAQSFSSEVTGGDLFWGGVPCEMRIEGSLISLSGTFAINCGATSWTAPDGTVVYLGGYSVTAPITFR